MVCYLLVIDWPALEIVSIPSPNAGPKSACDQLLVTASSLAHRRLVIYQYCISTQNFVRDHDLQ